MPTIGQAISQIWQGPACNNCPKWRCVALVANSRISGWGTRIMRIILIHGPWVNFVVIATYCNIVSSTFNSKKTPRQWGRKREDGHKSPRLRCFIMFDTYLVKVWSSFMYINIHHGVARLNEMANWNLKAVFFKDLFLGGPFCFVSCLFLSPSSASLARRRCCLPRRLAGSFWSVFLLKISVFPAAPFVTVFQGTIETEQGTQSKVVKNFCVANLLVPNLSSYQEDRTSKLTGVASAPQLSKPRRKSYGKKTLRKLSKTWKLLQKMVISGNIWQICCSQDCWSRVSFWNLLGLCLWTKKTRRPLRFERHERHRSLKLETFRRKKRQLIGEISTNNVPKACLSLSHPRKLRVQRNLNILRILSVSDLCWISSATGLAHHECKFVWSMPIDDMHYTLQLHIYFAQRDLSDM